MTSCGWMLQGQRAAAAGLFPWQCGLLMEADMGDRSRWHPLAPGYELPHIVKCQ